MNTTTTDFETIFIQKLDSAKWGPCDGMAINRGFLFGDGIFETMVLKNQKIRFSDFHKNRVKEGCCVLGLESSTLSTLEEIEEVVLKVASNNQPLRIRWNVFRAGLGKYTPETDRIGENLLIQSFHPAVPIKQHAYFNKEIFVPQTPWSHCKTLNALPYVLANRQRKQLGKDEVILLNSKGYISEAGAANIFWEQNGRFFTPSLECSCIAGVGRSAILKHFHKDSIPVEEGKFKPEELMSADRVFVGNVTGISYIQEIDGKRFDSSRIDYLDQLFH
jgi:4-amino-4-deoxychorismate lyase